MRARRAIRFYFSILKNLFGKPVVAIELTNRCNAHCTMCWRDEVKRKHTDIPFKDYKTIVDKLIKEGITTFQLSFFGESTLYHELVEAIAYVKQSPDTWVTLNTNAAYLDENLASNILAAGIDQVKVSVDGNNAEEYAKIRVGLKYDKVFENVRFLREEIKRTNAECTIQMQGLHLEDYRIDEALYHEKWSPLADEVIVREEHDLIAARKEPLLHRLLPCPKIASQMIVLVDGQASICAYDWHGKAITGNILRQSFRKLHYGSKRLGIILMHFVGLKRKVPICSTCSYQIYRY